ncbi:MAG: AAA family ATPase [Salinivirgaceae bacterium]|nr:AAA family ATPase [Salinivirgaceae bacterium]
MKLDINNPQLNEAIWTCLIEKFFYETRDFQLIFGNDCSFSRFQTGDLTEGYTHNLKIINSDCGYNFKFQNNDLIWQDQINRSRLTGCKGFISLYMSYYECKREKALLLLKSKFLEKCKMSDSCTVYKPRHKDRFAPGENFIPYSINYKNRIFKRAEFYQYYSIKGYHLGLILTYRDDNDYFELPFFIEKFNLSEMSNLQFVHFSDMLFDNYNCAFPFSDSPGKIILLCDDFFLSEKINHIIHESSNPNFKNKYFSISLKYVCDKYKLEIINDFINNEMVYIPSANKDSFNDFLKFLNKSKISYDIKIYKTTVFIDDGSSTYLNIKNPDLFEDYLMQYAEISDCLNPQYIEKIYNEAIGRDEFEKWARIIGLLAPDSSNIETGLIDLMDFMKSININKSNAKQDYYWDKFFSPQNINLVVAPTHSGKTFFLLTIAYFLSLGIGSFGLKAKKKYKVLYIDGESTEEYFGQMMDSLITEASFLNAQQSTSFHPYLFKQFRGDFDWDFSNDKFIDMVTSYISNGVDLVVVDNLNSLARRFVTSSCKWDSFIQWINDIQKKYSTAIILAHHTNKKHETLGLGRVEDMSHNLIQLFGNESIINNFNLKSEDDIKPIKIKMNEGNFVMGLNFKKCQSYVDLQDSKYIYSRNKNHNDSTNKWSEIYLKANVQYNEIDKIIDDVNLDLNFRLLNYARKYKEFKASDVEKFFKVSRSKITICINALKNQGIKKYGKGPATKYMYLLDDK